MLLIAPDSFKGSYSASQVAAGIARGMLGGADVCPVADGGEGTMEIVVAAHGGTTTDVAAHDALGRAIVASLGWLDEGATAIVETALASGIGLIGARERDAEAASTFGTGELIAAAAAAGAGRIVVTAGGTATTDGGAGAIEAIEAAGGLDGVELIVACDVRTPFESAAVIYARQKGADEAAIDRLSERLAAYAMTLPRDPRGMPMTGAAGGLSGGLWASYGAELVPGARWVLDAVGFERRMLRAEAVVTGEGCLDQQTFEGKLLGEIAARCRQAGKPLHGVVGSNRLAASEAAALALASIHVAPDETAMEAAGRAIAAVTAGAAHTSNGGPPRPGPRER